MSLRAQLEPTIRARAVAQTLRAGLIIGQRLDNAVPRDTGATARSQRIRPSVGARSVTISVEYPTPLANILNDGPRAHVIRARRASVLRFVKGGRVVFARQVNWRPGAGVAKNKGWFTKTVTQAAWLAALRQAFR